MNLPCLSVECVVLQHPRLRALFDRFSPHFVSADPSGGGLSWKRNGGKYQLDGWTYGRLDENSL